MTPMRLTCTLIWPIMEIANSLEMASDFRFLFYDVHGPYHSSIDLTFPVFSHVWYFIYYHHSFKLWGVPPHIRIYGLNCVNCTISTKYWPYKPYSSRFLQLPKIMLWILTQTDKNIVWNLSWQKSFSSLKFIKYNLNES